MKRLGAMSAAMIDALSADRGSEMLAEEKAEVPFGCGVSTCLDLIHATASISEIGVGGTQ